MEITNISMPQAYQFAALAITLQRNPPSELSLVISPTNVRNLVELIFFLAALALTKDKIFDPRLKSTSTSLAFPS